MSPRKKRHPEVEKFITWMTRKGGKARAASLTPQERKDIASQGGASRWKGLSAEERKKLMDKVRAKRTYHKKKTKP
jgi:general stress protein YciG